MVLATLLFAILQLEVLLGHLPVLMRHVIDFSAIPIVTIPLAAAALAWPLLTPTRTGERLLQGVMALVVVVGLAGFFFHLAFNGVSLTNLRPLFLAHTWTGPACPTWPLAISLAGLIGLWGAQGLSSDEEYLELQTTSAAAHGYRLILRLVLGVLLVGLAVAAVPGLAAWGYSLLLLAGLGLAALLAASLFSLIVERQQERSSAGGASRPRVTGHTPEAQAETEGTK